MIELSPNLVSKFLQRTAIGNFLRRRADLKKGEGCSYSDSFY